MKKSLRFLAIPLALAALAAPRLFADEHGAKAKKDDFVAPALSPGDLDCIDYLALNSKKGVTTFTKGIYHYSANSKDEEVRRLRLRRVAQDKALAHLWILEDCPPGKEANPATDCEALAMLKDTDGDGRPDEARLLLNEVAGAGARLDGKCSKYPATLDDEDRLAPMQSFKLGDDWSRKGDCQAWRDPIAALLKEAGNLEWGLSDARGNRIAPFVKDVSKAGLEILGTKEVEKGGPKATILSRKSADALFAILGRQTIPFGYPEDGCYARAHEMSRLLESVGVITAKVFVEGNLRVETKKAPGGSVNWWYHVAPLLIVREADGSEETVVMDPSILSRPEPVKNWVGVQTRHDSFQSPRVYMRDRWAYSPNNGSQSAWDESDLRDSLSTLRDYLNKQRERDEAREKLEKSRKEKDPLGVQKEERT